MCWKVGDSHDCIKWLQQSAAMVATNHDANSNQQHSINTQSWRQPSQQQQQQRNDGDNEICQIWQPNQSTKVATIIGKWQQQWRQQLRHYCNNEMTMSTTKITAIKHHGNNNQTSLVQHWSSMTISMARVQQQWCEWWSTRCQPMITTTTTKRKTMAQRMAQTKQRQPRRQKGMQTHQWGQKSTADMQIHETTKWQQQQTNGNNSCIWTAFMKQSISW